MKSDENFRDGYEEVQGKAISGKIDNSIGLDFRYRDANNYYVVRTNALESDIGMYRVVGGQRTPIARSVDSTAQATGRVIDLLLVGLAGTATGDRIFGSSYKYEQPWPLQLLTCNLMHR